MIRFFTISLAVNTCIVKKRTLKRVNADSFIFFSIAPIDHAIHIRSAPYKVIFFAFSTKNI